MHVDNSIISAMKYQIKIITTLLRSIIFIKNNLGKALCFRYREDLLTRSLDKVEFDGLFMEFGVFKGKSINYIASQIGDKTVYGFDSFEGIPEYCARIHMDAVLHSSTKYVLFTLAENNRLRSGTVIEFDEIFNYESWWNYGEYWALLEFANEFSVTFEYIGYLEFQFKTARPVSIKILKINS